MKEEEGKKSIEKVRKKKDEIDEHEGEKRSLLALWQLQRVPRRITRALDATDCQQDPPRRSLNGDAQHELTHTHTSHTHTSHTPPWTSSCYLFHLFPLLVQHFCPFPLPSSTFFSPPNASPPFFSHSLFFYRSFSLSEQQREERRGHRQVAYAPSSGLFYVLTRTEDGCPGGETTPPPSTPSTPSLTSCFSHSSSLFFPLGGRVLCFTVCPFLLAGTPTYQSSCFPLYLTLLAV